MVRKFKVGDYVEVLPGRGNSGVKDGEQGLIIGDSHQGSLALIFPASPDSCWSEDGWLTSSTHIKLVQQFNDKS